MTETKPRTLLEAAQALDAVLVRGDYLDAGQTTPAADRFYAAWRALRDALALPAPSSTTEPDGADGVIGWMTDSDAAALRRSGWGAVRVHRKRPLSNVTFGAGVRVRVTPAPTSERER